MTPQTSDDYAKLLASVLKRAAEHRHRATEPWSQGLDEGGAARFAFDVELCDADDLPAGYTARVVVSVTPSS